MKECWITMPNEFFVMYEYNNNYYEIVQVCDNFFYEKDTVDHINYCIPNCKSINYYFISGNTQCQSSCALFSRNYYNEINNECFPTCTVLSDFKYSNPIDTTTPLPQKCLNKCDKYFITKTINGSLIYECVESCPITDNTYTYNYIDIKTNECLPSCSLNAHYEVNS